MRDQGLNPAEILLVEDNLDDVEITLRAFRKVRLANTVHVVRDGQEALDFLFREGNDGDRADAPQPDVILLDLNLPKVNGLEVLDKIRASDELSTIPVIVLTVSEREKTCRGATNWAQTPTSRSPWTSRSSCTLWRFSANTGW